MVKPIQLDDLKNVRLSDVKVGRFSGRKVQVLKGNKAHYYSFNQIYHTLARLSKHESVNKAEIAGIVSRIMEFDAETKNPYLLPKIANLFENRNKLIINIISQVTYNKTMPNDVIKIYHAMKKSPHLAEVLGKLIMIMTMKHDTLDDLQHDYFNNFSDQAKMDWVNLGKDLPIEGKDFYKRCSLKIFQEDWEQFSESPFMKSKDNENMRAYFDKIFKEDRIDQVIQSHPELKKVAQKFRSYVLGERFEDLIQLSETDVKDLSESSRSAWLKFCNLNYSKYKDFFDLNMPIFLKDFNNLEKALSQCAHTSPLNRDVEQMVIKSLDRGNPQRRTLGKSLPVLSILIDTPRIACKLDLLEAGSLNVFFNETDLDDLTDKEKSELLENFDRYFEQQNNETKNYIISVIYYLFKNGNLEYPLSEKTINYYMLHSGQIAMRNEIHGMQAVSHLNLNGNAGVLSDTELVELVKISKTWAGQMHHTINKKRVAKVETLRGEPTQSGKNRYTYDAAQGILTADFKRNGMWHRNVYALRD